MKNTHSSTKVAEKEIGEIIVIVSNLFTMDLRDQSRRGRVYTYAFLRKNAFIDEIASGNVSKEALDQVTEFIGARNTDEIVQFVDGLPVSNLIEIFDGSDDNEIREELLYIIASATYVSDKISALIYDGGLCTSLLNALPNSEEMAAYNLFCIFTNIIKVRQKLKDTINGSPALLEEIRRRRQSSYRSALIGTLMYKWNHLAKGFHPLFECLLESEDNESLSDDIDALGDALYFANKHHQEEISMLCIKHITDKWNATLAYDNKDTYITFFKNIQLSPTTLPHSFSEGFFEFLQRYKDYQILSPLYDVVVTQAQFKDPIWLQCAENFALYAIEVIRGAPHYFVLSAFPLLAYFYPYSNKLERVLIDVALSHATHDECAKYALLILVRFGECWPTDQKLYKACIDIGDDVLPFIDSPLSSERFAAERFTTLFLRNGCNTKD